MSALRKHSRLLALGAGTLLAGAALFGGTAASAEDAGAMAPPCDDGWLCVYGDANGQGERVDLYECTFFDIGQSELGKLGSFNNNQFDGTVATFYGWDPESPDGPWVEQYTSQAPEFVDNDQGLDTYGVQVCPAGAE